MKSDSIYIEHIINSINSIQEYISELSLETFLIDRKSQDAVVRQFEIIGEATKGYPQICETAILKFHGLIWLV